MSQSRNRAPSPLDRYDRIDAGRDRAAGQGIEHDLDGRPGRDHVEILLADAEIEAQMVSCDQFEQAVAGVHPLAELRAPFADDACERCFQRVSCDDGPLLTGGGPSGSERRLVARDLRAQGFDLRASDAALRTDLVGLSEATLCVVEFDLALAQLGFGALQRELRQFRVEFEQRLTGLDAIAFVDRELGHEPGDRRAQDGPARRRDGAGDADLVDNRSARYRFDLHRRLREHGR